MSLLEKMLQNDPNIDMTKLYGIKSNNNNEGIKASQEIVSLVHNAITNPNHSNIKQLVKHSKLYE